ncbi:MAG: sensor histidine kinase, partial [Anaerolineales bacterium]
HIAQELHDELGQALTAISLDLGIIERELDPETDQDIAQRLSATRAMVDELDERISELALDLRPSLLDDLGLLPALRWYVDRYSQRAEVEIEMDINGLEERLSPEMETTLYRVFQEALTNVARHAQASKVRLQINRQPTAVVVNIEDDGRGFDAEEFQIKEVPLRSLGLAGMKERISHLGGHLDIRSKPGEGTRIDIEIPL